MRYDLLKRNLAEMILNVNYDLPTILKIIRVLLSCCEESKKDEQFLKDLKLLLERTQAKIKDVNTIAKIAELESDILKLKK